jgi:hypothetical protein
MSDGVGMGVVGAGGPSGGLAGQNLGTTAGSFAGNAISTLTNQAANAMVDKGATQGQLINQALAMKGDTSGNLGALVANKAAMQAAIMRGGGNIAGQAVIAAGEVKDAAANVAEAATGAIGSGVGGIFSRAGSFVNRLTGRGDSHASSSSGIAGGVIDDRDGYVMSSDGSGYVMSSQDGGYTLSDDTTWSDDSSIVTTVDGVPVSSAATAYSHGAPMSSGVVGVGVPSSSTGTYSSGTAGVSGWQSTGGQIVTQGGLTTGSTPQQYSLEGAQQGAQPAAAAAAAAAMQSGSGLVSVTGPFPDTAAAFASKAHSRK